MWPEPTPSVHGVEGYASMEYLVHTQCFWVLRKKLKEHQAHKIQALETSRNARVKIPGENFVQPTVCKNLTMSKSISGNIIPELWSTSSLKVSAAKYCL